MSTNMHTKRHFINTNWKNKIIDRLTLNLLIKVRVKNKISNLAFTVLAQQGPSVLFLS